MTKSTNPLYFVADLLDSVADKLEESIKNTEANKPEQKEASNTTGGSWEEDGEILNPFMEAQRVLGKVEEVADNIDSYEQKAAALLEVAKIHNEIGKQLLDDFIR